MIERLRQHWEQLQVRERRVLLFGAVAVILMGLYVLVWEPVVVGRAKLEQEVAEQQELLAWMEQSAREVQALRGSNRNTGRTGGQSIMSVVDSTARTQGLSNVLEVQPEGDNTVRIRLSQASFDQTLRWLDKLVNEKNLRITGLVVERRPEPGKVDARITLEAGA